MERELLMGGAVPDANRESAVRQTPDEKRREIRKFAMRLSLFAAPLCVFVLALEFLLWRVGETWPLERVIHFQETHPRSYFGRLFLDQGTFRYKYLQILRRRPQILVLGSSRTMQFRAEMFGSQASSFYNAGGMIHSIEDVDRFLDLLPEDATPKLVILGLDFWWLNADVPRLRGDSFAEDVKEDGTYRWQGHANAIAEFVRRPRLFRDLITRSFGKKRNVNAIGALALFRQTGFRIDGSKRFDLKIPRTPEAWRRRLPIEKARADFESADMISARTGGISPALTAQLRAVLLKLKARGAFVVAYSPPVITAWDEILSNSPWQRDFWKQYHETVPEIFRELDIPFFDISTPADLGGDDRYMHDAYHPHETFDLILLQHFCEEPRIGALLPDVPSLAKSTLDSPRTNPLVPDLVDLTALPADATSPRPTRRHRPRK